MASIGSFQERRKAEHPCSDDGWRLADPFDLHAPPGGSSSPRARRVGTTLFWVAVVSLIAARVVLFDPDAARPIGGFVQASAVVLTR